MADGDTQATPLAYPRRNVRQAAIINPDTGETITNRKVSLRDPKVFGQRKKSFGQSSKSRSGSVIITGRPTSWHQRLSNGVRRHAHTVRLFFSTFVTTREGQGALRCSLAYFLATLAVFVSPLSSLLGVTTSQNLVANFVVWFHPFRSIGNMEYGIVLAFVAWIYGAVIAYFSMGVVAFFASRDMISVGHAIILVVSCGGGLGLIAWVKQRSQDMLINVSCSLAAIPITTVLTMDPATRDGYFSHNTVSQVLRTMIMAIIITLFVNVFVLPISSIHDLRENLAKATSAYADILAGVTASFLTGSEDDINHPAVSEASDRFNKAFDGLDQTLADGKFEHYVAGTEKQYWIEKRLVDSIKRLKQDLGGLRSAATIQFALLAESIEESGEGSPSEPLKEPEAANTLARDVADLRAPMLQPTTSPDVIDDSASDSSSVIGGMEYFFSARPNRPSISLSKPEGPSVASSGHIFATFIEHLGPHLQSLAFTLNRIFNDLPLDENLGFASSLHPHFRPSLSTAIDLFEKSRKEALVLVYKSKAITQSQSQTVAAGFEDVAASCGHFSSSLQDLAEGCLVYLDTVNELDLEVNHSKYRRSWNWLCFWRRGSIRLPDDHESHKELPVDAEREVETSLKMSSLATRRYKAATKTQEKVAFDETFRYKLWKSLHIFRRDDFRFAIKVGIGAILLAMLAYIPATQPRFYKWRMQWALATYMFVCAMTVGAANSGIFPRVKGTLIGAFLSVIVWIIAQGNVFALAFLCWFISLGSFYNMLVLNQGPMSRFILLTFNLSVLYSYSLAIVDDDEDSDEGGVHIRILHVVWHRLVAVILGILWGLFVTQAVLPISARRKFKTGLSLLWLRMALIWKRAPLSVLLDDNSDGTVPAIPKYMDIREEQKLRDFAAILDKLRTSAESEFVLRGPFDSKSYDELLKSTGRMLDGFHALNVLISKDLKASPGEKVILKYTSTEREELSRRVSHLFSVLASSVKLQYPLSDTLPEIEHNRDRLLAKVFRYRTKEMTKGQSNGEASEAAGSAPEPMPTDEDFEVLYAFALVTKQIAKEIEVCSKVLERLYGVLSEDVLRLQ